MNPALKVTTPSDREITLTRAFNAPKRLVFDAYTKPEILRRWFGPPGWTMTTCEVDLRVGGAWRYVMAADDGSMKMGFGGKFLEVAPAEKLVSTEKFDEAWYEGDALDTQTFVEQGGRTTVTTTILYASKEIRDAVLKSPMADGMGAGMDRLDALLAAEAR